MTKSKEIEVTPEMLEAGAEALRGYDLDGDMPQEVAMWVFEAMERARRGGKQKAAKSVAQEAMDIQSASAILNAAARNAYRREIGTIPWWLVLWSKITGKEDPRRYETIASDLWGGFLEQGKYPQPVPRVPVRVLGKNFGVQVLKRGENMSVALYDALGMDTAPLFTTAAGFLEAGDMVLIPIETEQ